jgi:hypothetical protein
MQQELHNASQVTKEIERSPRADHADLAQTCFGPNYQLNIARYLRYVYRLALCEMRLDQFAAQLDQSRRVDGPHAMHGNEG